MDSLLERVQALSLIAILSYSLPVILVSFIRKRESTENWLMVCFAYSLVSEICALTLMYFRFNPNYAVNQYNLLSSFCLFAFFYHAIPGGKSKWAFVIPAAIISVAVCFTFFRYGVDGHISYTMALQSIAIIAYSLIYFYRTMKELPDGEISKQPMFWIISGFFLSYAGKFFVYAVSRYLLDWYNDNLILLWDVHNGLTVVGNSLILAGVIIRLSRKHSRARIVA